MTEGTCKQRLQVERLDRTQPPPGWSASLVEVAWAHYEARHDPPGTWAWGLDTHVKAANDTGIQGWADGDLVEHQGEVLAAAWTWYWRRAGLSVRVDAEVVVLIEHYGGGASSRVLTSRARAADALRPMLTIAADEDAQEETIAEVERLFAEGRLVFEGDPPIELAAVDVWPRCLAWTDEQVAAVERWLAEGGAPPEVLGG